MQEIFSELAVALRARLAVIADAASRRDAAQHLERLQSASEKIEEIEQQLPAAIDPQLRHYLQRRSYDKALAFIEESAG